MGFLFAKKKRVYQIEAPSDASACPFILKRPGHVFPETFTSRAAQIIAAVVLSNSVCLRFDWGDETMSAGRLER